MDTTMAAPMETVGFSMIWIALAVGGFALFVLAVLMPWYVYRASQYARQVRDEVSKTREEVVWRLDAIRRDSEKKEAR